VQSITEEVSDSIEVAVELEGVTKALGGTPVVNGINLTVRRGEFFSLLGPSGCGKSTTMRLIAGFEKPDSGSIRINGAATNGTPAYARDVNMVFQNYALFPHMTVRQNIGFGLEMMKVPEDERKRQVEEMLGRVRMEPYGERLPRELSGGQQQRVAVARALVTKPAVVLLDEPLGALDLKLRKEMQGELRELQSSTGLTFIYVTHDQEEALTMSDRLAVMHKGRILQVGTPEDIYERPETRFVADFIGQTNFLQGCHWSDELADGHVVIDVLGARVRAPARPDIPHEGEIVLAIRPERISLSKEAPDAQNRFEVVIEDVVYFGTARHYHVRLHNSVPMVVRQENRDTPTVKKGDRAFVSWPADAVNIVTNEEG
jgi:spermidine/putrescine transport system ATP-binding protein